MRYYTCTIMSGTFEKRFRIWSKNLFENNIFKHINELNLRFVLHMYWNNTPGMAMRMNTEINNMLPDWVRNPEVVLKDFPAQDAGKHSQPKIDWHGKIMSINSINEVIGFKEHGQDDILELLEEEWKSN